MGVTDTCTHFLTIEIWIIILLKISSRNGFRKEKRKNRNTRGTANCTRERGNYHILQEHDFGCQRDLLLEHDHFRSTVLYLRHCHVSTLSDIIRGWFPISFSFGITKNYRTRWQRPTPRSWIRP